ncbi:MAG: ABC transporter ATP-binding protein [Betaproteobacteria bacterium]|jgi:peptide/nickel transport system ATP-binding protein|nr:ABC transporter ATP-binding protein [Betaproteobacteria bacterium]
MQVFKPEQQIAKDGVLLEVEHLGVNFKSADGQLVQAVKGLSFNLAYEQILAVVGESGSGKSVSSLAIMGLLPPRSATIDPASQVRFRGQSLLGLSASAWRQIRGRKIAMIFQDPMSSLNPVYSIGYQLAEMLRIHEGQSHSQATKAAIDLLEEVGMPEPRRRIHAYPHELSGGQQQRVMIAMAIACSPELLIADEPTTALDVTIQRQILELLLRLKARRRMSMLFITHDLGLVGEFADEVVVMRHGEIREAGSAMQIFTDPKDAYTRALIHCRPDPVQPRARLLTIDDWNISPQALQVVNEQKESAPIEKPSDTILEVKGLRKVFPRRVGLWQRDDVVAVDDVSFRLMRGKTLGIVGESGSGKTTAGLCAVRLHQATAGQILFDGKDLLAMSESALMPLKRRLQIVFQNPYASLNPRFTVGQILNEPMMLHGIGSSAAERALKLNDLLDRVGLPANSVNRYPHEFSGGQRQRIAIARCLALTPDVIVCDEAVSALDVSVQAQVLNLLKDLQHEFSLSYLFISHDLGVVRYMADDLIVMHQGRVVEQGSADSIYNNPKHAYTRELLQAVPHGFRSQEPSKA